jgi:hypothetical protein
MSTHDFHGILPEVDKTTEWFFEEIIYCLQRYANMSEEEAFKALATSQLIESIKKDGPERMWREPAFDWAMCIVHGFDSYWWHDKELWALQRKYVEERHHPPMPD